MEVMRCDEGLEVKNQEPESIREPMVGSDPGIE